MPIPCIGKDIFNFYDKLWCCKSQWPSFSSLTNILMNSFVKVSLMSIPPYMSEIHVLDQESASSFCKEPGSKYYRSFKPDSLWNNCLILLWCEGSHGEYGDKWTQDCVLVKCPDLTHSLLIPVIDTQITDVMKSFKYV